MSTLPRSSRADVGPLTSPIPSTKSPRTASKAPRPAELAPAPDQDVRDDPEPKSDRYTEAAAKAATWLIEKIGSGRKIPHYAVKLNQRGEIEVKPSEPDQNSATVLLCYAVGSASFEFAHSVLMQLANAPGTKASDPDGIAAAIQSGLSFIARSEPNNELETMLLLQAWMTHQAVLTRQRSLAAVETIEQLDANGRLVVKLGRLFAQQVETLAKLRTAGKQVIEVQHVHVYPGGQAVVGTVNTRGGSVENLSRPQTPVVAGLAFEPGSPVWSEDPARETMRQPCGEGSTALPAARVREGRGRSGGGCERSVPNGRTHEGDGRGAAGSPGPDGGNEGAAGDRVGEDAADPSEG